MRKSVLILFFVCATISGQRADFFKEDITFRLDGIHFNVEGYYWFTNSSNEVVKSNIFYPFPNYANEKIDSVNVFNISAGQQAEFVKEGKHGISFNMFIQPGDTALFQIGYRHELASDSAVYILRTTKGWGKPLSQAEFKLVVPDSLGIKKFSYPPDKSYNIQGLKIYHWKMENFMPEKDMVFYF